MACNFYDEDSEKNIETQILEYCLTVAEGSGVSQTDQVTLFFSPDQAEVFNQNVCSDIEEYLLDQPEGNRQLYIYEEIEIWVYQVIN